MTSNKKNLLVLVLLLLILTTASATSNTSIHISSHGKLLIPFGKCTPGDDYKYCDTGSSGKKVGTNYTNLHVGNFNALFARFSNWPNWDGSYPKVKAGIVDSAGNLLDVSINEIRLQPTVQFEHLWHGFRLSKNLTLLPGNYYLCLWIGGYGAIAYSCSYHTYEQPSSFIMEEEYDNPTGVIGDLVIQRDFDIFASYREENTPPKAIIRIFTFVTTEVGSTITFDGSPSLPGFSGLNETQIVSYEWDFGDDTKTTGGTTQKTYSDVGEYKVTLRVTDSKGIQDTETVVIWVKPVEGYTSFIADFENAGDFSVGSEHTGNYKYWDRERYFMDQHPDAYRFWPEEVIVHSGTRSARLELVDPTDSETNRLQILHDWNSLRTEHIWQEEWFYFPSDMLWIDPDTGEPLWRTIHAMVTERMWTTGIPQPYQQFSWRISVIWNRYTDKLVFDITGLADVDNNDDGVADFPQPSPIYLELPGNESVPIGRWFRIKTHTYRNVKDWVTNQAGGYIEIWINDELGNEVYRKIENVHTIGIDPERIAALTPWKGDNGMAYVDSGFSHYCGGLSGSYGVASTIYVDDFRVETVQVP